MSLYAERGRGRTLIQSVSFEVDDCVSGRQAWVMGGRYAG